MPAARQRRIRIAVELGDVLRYPCDVLVLKYAQGLHGADAAVAAHLGIADDEPGKFPYLGETRLVPSRGKMPAGKVLFVGVPTLREFSYGEIRGFAKTALADLAQASPEAASVAITTHGAGYALDESEAFRSLVAGVVDAITGGMFPPSLASVTIVERNSRRAERLGQLLGQLVPQGGIAMEPEQYLRELDRAATEQLRSVGYASEQKPHVFVAMPFVSEMEDHYHYAVEPVVHAMGFLCLRADKDPFVGGILDRVKERIASASFIVADLSMANPNVYLEVGYAWGCGKPTVLLVRDEGELKFDVRGQRCLVYRSIRNLEEQLRKELNGLKASGAF